MMSNKGFTLLELLVVVLIIGILASIALPQYRRAVEKSRAMKSYQIAQTFARQVELFYLNPPDDCNCAGCKYFMTGTKHRNGSSTACEFPYETEVDMAAGLTDKFAEESVQEFARDRIDYGVVAASGNMTISPNVRVVYRRNSQIQWELRLTYNKNTRKWTSVCQSPVSRPIGKRVCESLPVDSRYYY